MSKQNIGGKQKVTKWQKAMNIDLFGKRDQRKRIQNDFMFWKVRIDTGPYSGMKVGITSVDNMTTVGVQQPPDREAL